MSFQIKFEGLNVWLHGVPDGELEEPVLEAALNAAGNLSFTMPPRHPYYHTIRPLLDTVEVWDGSTLIWFGRPVSLKRLTDNRKECYCEGGLAFFNDSVIRPTDHTDMTAAEVFSMILSAHNMQVPQNRRFTAGTVSMPSTTYGWENSYMASMQGIEQMLKAYGGYLIPRRSGSTNLLDYVQTLPQDSGQSVTYGVNMIDFQREYTYEDKFTAVLPVGGVPDAVGDGQEDRDPITIAEVNGNSDILDGDDVSTYGRIVKNIKFPYITDPQELMDAAQDYLDSVDFDPIWIKCSAADLSLIDQTKTPFRIGKQYRIVSTVHDVDAWVPLTKLTIEMDKAARQIQLGTDKAPGLVDFYRGLSNQLNRVKESVSPGSYGSDWTGRGKTATGYIRTYDPETDQYYDYTISDKNNHFVRSIAVNMVIVTPPNQLVYTEGDTIDYTGLVVKLVNPDGSTYTDANYPNGIIPMQELQLPQTKANRRKTSIPVVWHSWSGDTPRIPTATDVKYTATFTITVNEGSGIAGIEIVTPPNKTSYTEGEAMDYTGIVVKLIDKDGNTYTDAEYPSGIIPMQELVFPVSVAPAGSNSGDSFSNNGINAVRVYCGEYKKIAGDDNYINNTAVATWTYQNRQHTGFVGTGILTSGNIPEPDYVYVTQYNGYIYCSLEGQKNYCAVVDSRFTGSGGQTEYMGWSTALGNGTFSRCVGSYLADFSIASWVPVSTVDPSGQPVTPTATAEIPVRWSGDGANEYEDTFTISVQNSDNF